MEKKNIINVLLAVPERDSAIFREQLKTTLKTSNTFQLLHFYTVHKTIDIDKYIEQQKVDVVICAEDLGLEKVGQGSIRRWKQYDESLRIVMILFDEKRKGQKVSNFLKNGYYDAIFFSDLNPKTIIDIINKGRTMKEANDYYFSDEMVTEEKAAEVIEDISLNGPIYIEEKEEQREEVYNTTEKVEEELIKNELLEQDVEAEEKSIPEKNEVAAYVGEIEQVVDQKMLVINIEQLKEPLDKLEGRRILLNVF